MKNKILSIILLMIAFGVSAQIDRSKMPEPGPSPKINFGETHEFTLKNGLKVIVVENHKLPKVSATLAIDNPLYSLGEKKGVENILASVLGNGTTTKSKDEFNKRIDFLGAWLFYNGSGAYVSSLAKYFPEVLSLMADGAINPVFTQEDFDREKSLRIEGVKANEKDVETAGIRVRDILVYGEKHPYSEYVSVDKLEKLQLNDVKTFYNTYYKPNNAYLIIVGDINAKEAENLVKKNFGSWKKGNIAAEKISTPASVTKTEIEIVNMPNAVQSIIDVSYPVNLTKNSPDYFPLLVASNILGGDFNSKLNMNLREAHGWTYGARGGVKADKYIGRFYATAKVRNEVTDSAVFETMKEIKNMTIVRVDEDLLESVKAKFLGNFILSLEKPETVASQALSLKTDNLPDSFYKNYIAEINKVTIYDVLRVAQKYFKPENAKIVIAGKGKEIAPALKRLGYPINFYDSYGKKLDDIDGPKVDASVTVQSVMDKYLTAIGGVDKTKAVKSVMTNLSAEVQGMALTIKAINTSNAQSLEEVSMMGNVMQKSVFNGTTGYNQAQGQKIDFTAEEIANKKVDALPFPELVLAKQKDVSLSGIEDFNGKKAYAISKGKSTIYYDVETGLKLGESTVMEMQGQTMTQTTMLEDYKEVKGIKYPHKMVQNAAGVEIVANVTEIKINEGVSEADFQ